MSKESERQYIEGRMEALFKAAHPTVPIDFANSNFKEPENQVYASLRILGGKGVTVGGSNGKKVIDRYPGIVQITFWSPDETGTKQATLLVDTAARIFRHHRGRDIEGNVITFKSPEYPSSGKVNGWYPTIIKIPFYRDEEVPVS